MREKRLQHPEKSKVIKKYKHESRHLHAQRRQRHANGRFVTQKMGEEADDNKLSDSKSKVDESDEKGDNSQDLNIREEIQKSKYKLND